MPDREVPSDAGVERGRDQLTTMVSVDRLTRPPHSIRGGQPPQHVKVVQDQFHQDILAHRPPGRDIRPEAGLDRALGEGGIIGDVTRTTPPQAIGDGELICDIAYPLG